MDASQIEFQPHRGSAAQDASCRLATLPGTGTRANAIQTRARLTNHEPIQIRMLAMTTIAR